MHNLEKSSIFATETEDGVAGGAHAESFITQQKSLPPSIEVSVYILIKAFIGACFGPLESAIFTTQNKNGNERLQDMISPFVYVRRLSYSAWAYKLFIFVEGFCRASMERISKEGSTTLFYFYSPSCLVLAIPKNKLL